MNRIKEIRDSSGISQAKLYRKLRWSQARLSNYERGVRKTGLDDARSVVNALNEMGASCTLDEVFPPVENENPAFLKTS